MFRFIYFYVVLFPFVAYSRACLICAHHTTTRTTNHFHPPTHNYAPDAPRSDEVCQLNEFQCDGTRCIPLEKRCDQIDDCSDHTDELNCNGTQRKKFTRF